MSGLAVWFARADAAPPLLDEVRFQAVGHAPRTYRDDGVAIRVAGRLRGKVGVGSYGELVVAGPHVLACEGYLHLGTDPGGEGRGQAVLRRFRGRGVAALEDLRGAFSLVIWDREERVGIVVTCAFGQRTLYQASSRTGLVFATDLETLGRLRGGGFELDEETLWMSLQHGGVFGPGTPFRGVGKVLPGTIITVADGSATERLAGDQPRSAAAANEARSTAEHLEALDRRMAAAADRLKGVADTQALMMGSGVDSTLVGVYARTVVPDLIAITQGMPGALDETTGAERSARALGVRHEVVPYEPSNGEVLVEEVQRFVRIAGEPAYWNQLGPALLRLLTRLPERPEAFLTGAEGDHLCYFRSRRRPSFLKVLHRRLALPAAVHTARRLVNRVTRHTHIVAADFDLLDRALLREHLAVELPEDQDAESPFYPAYPHLGAGANAQRHFINNAWQNVRIISQLAAEAGAEAVFPYLDHAVAAYLLAVPDELKINKILLRKLLARRLPEHRISHRKMGYWAHTVRWHHERGALGPVLDLLLEPRTLQRGIFDRPRVRALVDAYGAGRVRAAHHPVLWQLLLFEAFCRVYLDRPVPPRA